MSYTNCAEYWWIRKTAEYHLKYAREGCVYTAMLYMVIEALGDDPYDYV